MASLFVIAAIQYYPHNLAAFPFVPSMHLPHIRTTSQQPTFCDVNRPKNPNQQVTEQSPTADTVPALHIETPQAAGTSQFHYWVSKVLLLFPGKTFYLCFLSICNWQLGLSPSCFWGEIIICEKKWKINYSPRPFPSLDGLDNKP